MAEVDLKVLSNLLSDKRAAIDFVNSNDVKIFSADTWNFANLVFNCVKKYNEVPTLRVLKDVADQSGNEVLASSVEVIWGSIQNTTSQVSELSHDLDVMKRRFAENEILSVKNELAALKPGSVDVNRVLTKFQNISQSINALHNESLFDSKHVGEYLEEFVDLFNRKKNNPEEENGLITGYSFLDFATNGLKPADMLLIAGESGFGKSLFLQNIAIQAWMGSNKVGDSDFKSAKNMIYFSLEMPYADMFNRLISKMSGVESRRIENATLTKAEFDRVKDCLQFMHAYPNKFRIVDMVDASANDLEAEIIKTGEQFDAVFVDYLGIMQTNDSSDESDWLKQGVISYELRRVGRRLKVPMFSAVQLNRKPQKESADAIGLSRLARSKEIATHATHIIQIESRQNENQYPDFIYHFIKNRKGPKGKGILNKNLSCATLLDKELTEEELALQQNGFGNMPGDISTQLNSLEDLGLDFLHENM